MLTITHNAATVLERHRAAAGAPDTFGVRLSTAPDTEAMTQLLVTFVPAPLPGDSVTEQEGVRMFLEAGLDGRLQEASLDATPDDGTPSDLVLWMAPSDGASPASNAPTDAGN